MFEFYQLIPSIAFITGKDYCQTGTTGTLEKIRASVFELVPFLFGPALSLLFRPLDDYECDVVILGGIGCVV